MIAHLRYTHDRLKVLHGPSDDPGRKWALMTVLSAAGQKGEVLLSEHRRFSESKDLTVTTRRSKRRSRSTSRRSRWSKNSRARSDVRKLRSFIANRNSICSCTWTRGTRSAKRHRKRQVEPWESDRARANRAAAAAAEHPKAKLLTPAGRETPRLRRENLLKEKRIRIAARHLEGQEQAGEGPEREVYLKRGSLALAPPHVAGLNALL